MDTRTISSFIQNLPILKEEITLLELKTHIRCNKEREKKFEKSLYSIISY